MNSRIKTTTTDQSDAFNAATEQSIVLWNARCGNDIVQEGDRVGVMRAFGMTWVTAAFLTEYRIGFDYTNRIDLLDREGYLNTVDDSITLKFFVRAPCYSQHCQDQERHITNL